MSVPLAVGLSGPGFPHQKPNLWVHVLFKPVLKPLWIRTDRVCRWTALMFAAKTGQTRMVEMLIDAGAELDAKENDDGYAGVSREELCAVGQTRTVRQADCAHVCGAQRPRASDGAPHCRWRRSRRHGRLRVGSEEHRLSLTAALSVPRRVVAGRLSSCRRRRTPPSMRTWSSF